MGNKKWEVENRKQEMGNRRNIFSIDLRITRGSQYLTTPFMME
jgi:hypothetical protein